MLASTQKHQHTEDVIQVQRIDHVEWYVGDALHTMHYYHTNLGYVPLACAGLETGVRDRITYIVQGGSAQFHFTSALESDHAIATFVNQHGCAIKDIAFEVEDVEVAFALATKHGAKPVLPPTVIKDQQGSLKQAIIQVFGDITHSFIQRSDYSGSILPGYQIIVQPPNTSTTVESQIDHFSLCLSQDELDRWSDFYQRAFGFQLLHEESIETQYSAMHSKALQDPQGIVKFVMQAPMASKRKSQITEFLTYNQGSGIQHVATTTDDIITAIHRHKAAGLQFLATPGTYYDALEARIGHIEEDIAALRELNILVDRDEWGYLLQIFTRPMQSRPTFFIEVIQRRDARGFGSGNIKALFEAVEREQELRGNL